MSLTARAQEIHAAPQDPPALLARAEELTRQADALLEEAQNNAVVAVGRAARQARAAVGALAAVARGEATQDDLAVAGQALDTVARVAEQVTAALKPGGKGVPGLLMDLLPGAVKTLLPGVSLDQLKKGLAVAQRLASLARDPSIKGVVGVLQALRGGRSTGGVTDFLLSSVMGLLSGQPFDLGRFLPGALRAAGKDLKARGLSLTAGRTQASVGGTRVLPGLTR